MAVLKYLFIQISHIPRIPGSIASLFQKFEIYFAYSSLNVSEETTDS